MGIREFEEKLSGFVFYHCIVQEILKFNGFVIDIQSGLRPLFRPGFWVVQYSSQQMGQY